MLAGGEGRVVVPPAPSSSEIVMAKKVDDALEELNAGRKAAHKPLDPKGLLSTGSTLLNLALSGKAKGGLYKGNCYHFVGSSDSGKTFITLTCFAEASINKAFADYRFIHDNPEDGALMDMTRFFGPEAARRIRSPQGTRSEPKFSQSLEEFYYNLDDALTHERPCIYVLDSMDALTAKPDSEKFQKLKRQSRKPAGKEQEAGSYGTAKAKQNSAGMREVFSKLASSDSILIIISQEKMKVGTFVGFGDTTTYAGGLSLKYYSHAQLWSQPVGQIKKNVKGRDRSVGTMCLVKVKKNRQTGQKSSAKVPIYWSTGIDDTGANVDYLVDEKHWGKSGTKVIAEELGLEMNREDLIVHVEKNDMQDQLQDIVEGVWEEIKDACAPERVNKYHQKGE